MLGRAGSAEPGSAHHLSTADLEKWTSKIVEQSLQLESQSRTGLALIRARQLMRIVLSFPLFLILWEVDSPLNVLKWRMMAMNFLVYGLPLCVIIKLSDQPDKDQLLGPNSAKLYHYGLVCGNQCPSQAIVVHCGHIFLLWECNINAACVCARRSAHTCCGWRYPWSRPSSGS
jgi:hypothetical protein